MKARAIAALFLLSTPLLADDSMPIWQDSSEVPLPPWLRSVAPNKAEAAIYVEPGRLDARRGSAQPGARLPLYALRRGPGCQGRWMNVGPLSWMCSDVADFSPDDPGQPLLGSRPWASNGIDHARPTRPGARGLPPIDPVSDSDDGLPYRYYFAGRDGASGFANLATATEDSADQELEPGFAVAITDEQSAHGERWGRTKKGRWVAMRELGAARPNLFHGELVQDQLAVAWVVSDKATVFTTEKADKAAVSPRLRFEKIRTTGKETKTMVETEAGWMRMKDLARARPTEPPPEVNLEASERWIDVSLVDQTLVAYEGKKPVFATIVSTGKGPSSEFLTHAGTFRIWVKVFTTKMDNLDKDDVDKHYAIEDVPWVQFFDKAIALHGAFWHRDFGHVHSHGCVNLAPLDARWLFAFTGPHLPMGWTAVLPTKIDQGTVIRVH